MKNRLRQAAYINIKKQVIIISTHNKYKELVNLIHKYGEKYPKKHGNWIKLHYIKDYYFCMDSWNERISLYKNPIIEYWNIEGELICTLGIDFGGFKCYVENVLLECWIKNLKYELGLEYDFSNLV